VGRDNNSLKGKYLPGVRNRLEKYPVHTIKKSKGKIILVKSIKRKGIRTPGYENERKIPNKHWKIPLELGF